MFEDYLLGYNDDEYVYIIEGCMDYYVQDEPIDDDLGPCEICGSYDWPVADGYVGDIREARDVDDLYRIQDLRDLREKMIDCKNVLSNKTYYELLEDINTKANEKPKTLTLK